MGYGVDLQPTGVGAARGRLVILPHGLPGIDTCIVCSFSGLDKEGHNKTEKADDAPPPYSEMEGCTLQDKGKWILLHGTRVDASALGLVLGCKKSCITQCAQIH